MQIHELDNYSGSLGANAFVVIDNGSDTGKISTQELLQGVNDNIETVDQALSARIDNIIAGPTSSDQEVIDARLGADGIVYGSLGDAIRDQLTNLDNDIVHLTPGKNLFNKNDSLVKLSTCMINTGAELSNAYTTNYYATGYMKVSPNSAYLWTDYQIGSTMAVCFYDTDKTFISAIVGGGADGLVAHLGKFTTPAGTAFVRATGNTANINTAMLVKGSTAGEYEPYALSNPINSIKTINTHRVTAASFTSGNLAYSNAPNLKQKIISYDASVTTFGELTISNGKTLPYQSGYIYINDTYISVRRYTTGVETILTEDHHLDLTGHMNVTIIDKPDQTADIILCGKNGKHVIEGVYWEGCSGPVLAEIYQGNHKNVTFSYYCKELSYPLWAFGDSYFDMWSMKAIDLGVNNIMWDGRSGRGSADALTSLNEDLGYNTPKKLLWCLGMNDPDSGEVNAAWKSAFDSVVALCAANGTELILATIPNTPSYDHSYKNAIIRSSGYRYVDVSAAVGAEDSTSWYTGLLGPDNVHPTDLGRQVIACAFIACCPEMY